MEQQRDGRDALHLSDVQDQNGTDLSLLRENLRLTVEERLLRLQEQQASLAELLGAARRA